MRQRSLREIPFLPLVAAVVLVDVASGMIEQSAAPTDAVGCEGTEKGDFGRRERVGTAPVVDVLGAARHTEACLGPEDPRQASDAGAAAPVAVPRFAAAVVDIRKEVQPGPASRHSMVGVASCPVE